MAVRVALASLLVLGVRGDAQCRQLNADFIVLDGEATLLAMEDDIRAQLEVVGINVTTLRLAKGAFNEAMVSGDFNMAFSETWGPPYDPHSYASSWTAPDEGHYAALKGLPAPMTQAVLGQKISDVLVTGDKKLRRQKWQEILGAVHAQAIDLPFSGKRIPAVIGRRLSGYVSGHQQFEYPLHTLKVESGPTTVTVAPGAQTGLFSGVGRVDPHSYRPNEFFANNWVYEGFVEYGAGGSIQPSLAISWTIANSSSGGGQTYTFSLRQDVQFHDGAAWNCSVAKLNFDHVLAKPLTTGDWHGWYGLPGQITGWSCAGTYEFVVTTKDQYYPLLQELSYIRPLRMLSPTKFEGGLSSDPLTQNSCPQGWGNITSGDVTVMCNGTSGVSGTGRWKYVETITADDKLKEVVFDRNTGHWASDSGDVQRLRLLSYESHDAVKSALLAGTLDLVVGSGVLEPADIVSIRADKEDDFEVFLTEPIQNRIVILNSARAPTDDLVVRKTIIHAVDKAAIIDKELYGLAEPVDALFPKTAPYCDADLTPRWDYDLEKAQLLNCPVAAVAAESESEDSNLGLILGIVVAVVGVSCTCLVAATFFIGRSTGFKAAMAVRQEKKSNPMVLGKNEGEDTAQA